MSCIEERFLSVFSRMRFPFPICRQKDSQQQARAWTTMSSSAGSMSKYWLYWVFMRAREGSCTLDIVTSKYDFVEWERRRLLETLETFSFSLLAFPCKWFVKSNNLRFFGQTGKSWRRGYGYYWHPAGSSSRCKENGVPTWGGEWGYWYDMHKVLMSCSF